MTTTERRPTTLENNNYPPTPKIGLLKRIRGLFTPNRSLVGGNLREIVANGDRPRQRLSRDVYGGRESNVR